jgi:predicted phage terminase large subunit-like protein
MNQSSQSHLHQLLFHPNLNELLDNFLRQLQNTPPSPTWTQASKDYIYLRGFWDFQFFVETIFSHHCSYPFSKMHHDFFAAEAEPIKRGRREAIAAPRGHAKTTFKVIFKCLHAIVYGYEPFILIIGHSAPEAEGKVKEILDELESNALLKEIYGALAPQPGQAGCSKKDFVTQNGCRVLAKSRGKQVRGLKHGTHRPTLIILDDIEAPEKVIKEEQRYKTQQWLEKDILKLGCVDNSANIIMIGTCLHMEALLPTLLRSPGWHGKKYQAIESFAIHQGLWQAWKEQYTDLTNPEREQAANAFYEANQSQMLEGTQVLWPEGESYLTLQKNIINEGQASFQSEKQNDPYDPTRQIFDMNQAKRFRVEWLPDGQLLGFHWLDGSQRYVPASSIVFTAGFHDPALGKNKDGDYAAIVVCAGDMNGYIYCLDAYIEKVPPSRQIEQAFALHAKWKINKLCLEENGFQGSLRDAYLAKLRQGPRLYVKGVQQHHNKQGRIASLEPLVTNGRLLFNIDLTPRLISQMQLFPTDHDDGPDALQGAVEELKKRVGRY